MTIRYSYSDYTTKGHGVIEGIYRRSSAWRKKYEILYNVPKEYTLLETVSDVTRYIDDASKSNKTLRKDLRLQLKGKFPVKIGKYVIKKEQEGKFRIYTKNKAIKSNKKNNSTASDKAYDHKAEVERAYRHLKKIHDESAKNRKRRT